MNIPSIPGIGRVSTIGAGAPGPATPDRASPAVPAVEIDAVTLQPVPLRFPWLSRLSQQLESAARQRPAFPAAPVLGDNVDQAA